MTSHFIGEPQFLFMSRQAPSRHLLPPYVLMLSFFRGQLAPGQGSLLDLDDLDDIGRRKDWFVVDNACSEFRLRVDCRMGKVGVVRATIAL